MKHQRFDLQKWIGKFPLPADAADSVPSTLSGPRAMAYVEQMRALARDRGCDLGPGIATDVCIWSYGEGDKPDITRIGGLPFWPDDEPWPEADDGTPLTFVAQLSFADSVDILAPLPGDLLSVFAFGNDYMDLVAGWLTTEEVGSTLSRQAMPRQGWEIAPMHAQLHRTMDFPEVDPDVFDTQPTPLCWWGRFLEGCTKLGGAHREAGELPSPDEFRPGSEMRASIEASWQTRHKRERSFLCRLSSILLGSERDLVNPHAISNKIKPLMISDVGGYNFFQNGDETDLAWYSG